MDLLIDPPLPRPAAGPATPFLQTIGLTDGDARLGQARWLAHPDPAEGIAQVLEVWTAPAHGRRGLGRRLMETLTEQARQYFQARQSALRRLWIAIDQKRHIIARGFLMKFTFHHVGTVKELLKGEDLLIYMRTFD